MSRESQARDEQHNRQAIVQVGTMLEDTFLMCGALGLESIKYGSTLTGAPGQPVDEGRLLNSWQMEREGKDVIVIGTPEEYAIPIEDGIQAPYTRKDGTQVTPGPIVFRSEVGGAHSVALTVAGFDNIVEEAKNRTIRGGGTTSGTTGGRA